MSRASIHAMFLEMLAAIVDLNGRPGFAHWHFFEMSVPNIVVIVLMFVVFAIAVLAPFPGTSKRRRS